MPDIAATKPVAGAPIESAWGGQVHDSIEGIQSGQATVTVTNLQNGDQAVTFPRAYATPPIVVACVTTSTNLYYGTVNGITTTGFTLRATHRDGAVRSDSVNMHWIAIGTPA